MQIAWQASLLVIGSMIPFAAASAQAGPDEDAQSRQSTVSREDGLVARFEFDGGIRNSIDSAVEGESFGEFSFARGLNGEALSLDADRTAGVQLPVGRLPIQKNQDFSIQFWVRTIADTNQRFVVLSQKQVPDNSLASHKQAGWVFYVSHGTWAWNMGSGSRRIAYERDNGARMPLNDGRWHQLTMTHDKDSSVVRLYYDGQNQVTYNIDDSSGFDFSNTNPLEIGWSKTSRDPGSKQLPSISTGASQLQELVDRFNALGLDEKVQNDELMQLVTGPQRLFDRKLRALREKNDPEKTSLIESLGSVDLKPIEDMTRRLMRNPCTVHQSADFMLVAPLLKIFRLDNGRVTVNQDAAREFASRERLDRPEFDMDNLAIWNRVLSQSEVLTSFQKHFQRDLADLNESLSSLTVAAWNIHHGGKHETVAEDGWDSRNVIAEMIRRENVDIVLMQETYSSGDYIAAELGYYFATTVDWDYLNQGSNISVISRFPIREIDVPPSAPFMNVSARITLSKTQEIYAMSNWYGMNSFQEVADHHQTRFEDADRIPVLFAGDFNAVPHTDGGRSPASRHLLQAGFVDAYRSLFPDVRENPGPTHRGGSRIDQLYFKGSGLKNTSTTVLSTWPSRFPSDHFLIKSIFELDYNSRSR